MIQPGKLRFNDGLPDVSESDKEYLLKPKFYMKKPLLLLLIVFISTITFSQSRITGIVVDESGIPLPGVNVVEKIEKSNTPNGTITDLDGKFTLVTKQHHGEVSFTTTLTFFCAP